jgi:hypothetical protein
LRISKAEGREVEGKAGFENQFVKIVIQKRSKGEVHFSLLHGSGKL